MYGADRVIDRELEFFATSKKRIDTCMNYTRPSLAVIVESIKKAFLDAKSRGVKLRYLTEITPDNIAACKELMTIVDELRHLNGIKGNFMVSETEYLAPVILYEKGEIASQIICSNVKEILDQHQYMFDTLWSKAISAQQRIREIEEGIISYETKIIEEDEKKIIRQNLTEPVKINQVLSPSNILKARNVVKEVYMDEKIEKYIVDIIEATRHPENYKLPELKGLIQYGASPRATIHLAVASKAYAFLQGRGYVTPQDIKTIGMDVLRHRVIVSYEAEAEEKTAEDIVQKIFAEVEVP